MLLVREPPKNKKQHSCIGLLSSSPHLHKPFQWQMPYLQDPSSLKKNKNKITEWKQLSRSSITLFETQRYKHMKYEIWPLKIQLKIFRCIEPINCPEWQKWTLKLSRCGKLLSCAEHASKSKSLEDLQLYCSRQSRDSHSNKSLQSTGYTQYTSCTFFSDYTVKRDHLQLVPLSLELF